jgi:AcrR family transcriptional regulator
VARARLTADERRTQLLEVAGRLFAELGFHGVSMEYLADAAGVSKPVLYQHFTSKRELYLALVREAVGEMEAQVRKALDGTRDNRARVHGAIAAYVDFVEDRRFGLVFGSQGLADDEEVIAVIAEADARVADAVGSLIAEDAGLDEPAALLLASALRGLATLGARWWVEHPELDKETAVALLSRLAWRGLGGFSPNPAAETPVIPGGR